MKSSRVVIRREAEIMWKTLWQTWTVDKPARLGDWLWNAFVVTCRSPWVASVWA